MSHAGEVAEYSRVVEVRMSEMKVTDDRRDVLVAYGLGSCIAVMVYDPRLKIAGMLHYMLPLSSDAPDKAGNKPAMFADTGIPLLFNAMYKLGSRKGELIIRVAGGGKSDSFDFGTDIGRRNYVMLRKMFWRKGIIIDAEDVGGAKPRTASLYAATGRATVKIDGQVNEL